MFAANGDEQRRIARSETGRWAIGTIGGLGGDNRLLTNSGGNDILDAWSPDGHRLLFHSDREGANQVYLMSPDGSGQTRLTTGSDNWGGSWTPDSKAIAFTSGRTGRLQLYVMNVDGTGQRQLVTSAGNDWLPSWSPDGARLVFDSDRDGSTQVYVANRDGSGQVNVLRSPGVQLIAWTHRWSPDGRQIIYAAAGNPPATSTPFHSAGTRRGGSHRPGGTVDGHPPARPPTRNPSRRQRHADRGRERCSGQRASGSIPADPGRDLGRRCRRCPAVAGAPIADAAAALRLFAFLVPVVFYAFYFATLQLRGGIGWSIHLWLGTTVVAGIVGLLLSFLVLPPASPGRPMGAGMGSRSNGVTADSLNRDRDAGDDQVVVRVI